MWHAMFAEQIPLAEKILRTVIVYALIAVLFRLTGKRGLASMNTFDFVVIFLLSNVVQNAVIGNDTSLTGGIIGAVTLVTVNTVVNRLIAANATVARIFDGQPTTLISDGHVVDGALRHLGLRRSEIDHAVRLQNGDDVSQVAARAARARRPAGADAQGRRAGRLPRPTSPSSPAGSARSSACSAPPGERPGCPCSLQDGDGVDRGAGPAGAAAAARSRTGTTSGPPLAVRYQVVELQVVEQVACPAR